MELKRLPFLLALVALTLALAVELGKGGDFASSAARKGADLTSVSVDIARGLADSGELGVDGKAIEGRLGDKEVADNVDRPGKGIPALGVLDGLLFFTVVLFGLALIVPERIFGRLQGVISLVVSFLLLLVAIFLTLESLVLVFVMIGLLLAAPFGTIAYLAIWGSFEVGAAEATLGVLLLLKIAFGVCLVLAHPRFLQNKGLVLLTLTSLVANVVVSFLIGFPPRILASITDVVGAIVVAILAAIWAIFFLLFAIVSIVRVLRITRGSAATAAG